MTGAHGLSELQALDKPLSPLSGAAALGDLIRGPGTWDVQDGVLRVSAADEVYGRAFVGGHPWIDCIFEATVAVEQAGDVPWAGLRLIVRGDEATGNLTTIGLWCGDRTIVIEQSTGLKFETLKNSTQPAIAPFDFELGRPYRLCVIADRGGLFCFVDGQYVVHATEPTFASRPCGLVGFYAAKAAGTFSDITVRPLRRSTSPFTLHPASPLDISAYSPTVLKVGDRYQMWHTNRGQSYAESADGVHWVQPAGPDPVKPLSPAGQWGDQWEADADVLRYGDRYLMSNPACSSVVGGAWDGMGFQHSRDGVTWRAEPGNPGFFMGPTGAWDELVVGDHCMIIDGGVWKMWFTGITDWQRGFRNEFGYAESADGIHWRKCTLNPVVTQGAPGDWDGGWIYAAAVVKLGDDESQTRVYAGRGGSYHLFYTGQPTNDENVGGVKRLGWAFSLDGLHWVKYDDALTVDPPLHHSDPILTWTDWGSWGYLGLRACTALTDGDEVKIWFSGEGTSYTGTGLATAKVADLLRIVEEARAAGKLQQATREEIESTLVEPLPLTTWDDLARAVLDTAMARQQGKDARVRQALGRVDDLLSRMTRSERAFLSQSMPALDSAVEAIRQDGCGVSVERPWRLGLRRSRSFRPAYLQGATFELGDDGRAVLTAVAQGAFAALPPMSVPVEADLAILELEAELSRPGEIAVSWAVDGAGVDPARRAARRIRWPEEQRRILLVMPWQRGQRVTQLRIDLPQGATLRLKDAGIYAVSVRGEGLRDRDVAGDGGAGGRAGAWSRLLTRCCAKGAPDSAGTTARHWR